MKVKINDQLICIPPYISAHWNQISCIESVSDPSYETPVLKLHLINGQVISIPNLDVPLIETIFREHQLYLETSDNKKSTKDNNQLSGLVSVLQQVSKDIDVQILSSSNLVSSLLSAHPLDMILQHIPEHKDYPDASPEILEKIASIIRMFPHSSVSSQIKPERHCNCLHCQVGRLIVEEEQEDEVSQEDLSFREWDVTQNEDHLYVVTNPLDPNEQFSVYLGSPIGCTCGQQNCEHIRAVLYT